MALPSIDFVEQIKVLSEDVLRLAANPNDAVRVPLLLGKIAEIARMQSDRAANEGWFHSAAHWGIIERGCRQIVAEVNLLGRRGTRE